MTPTTVSRLFAAAALTAVTGLSATIPSSAATTPSLERPTDGTVPCVHDYVRTYTAVRVRQRPGLQSPTMRVIPRDTFVYYHGVKEDGWFRVSGPLHGGGWWFGFMSPTDPATGKTITTDGWARYARCVPGSRIPAPTPADSAIGRMIHRYS